jgi:hypothetical protein
MGHIIGTAGDGWKLQVYEGGCRLNKTVNMGEGTIYGKEPGKNGCEHGNP